MSHIVVPYDRWSYERNKQARALGMNPDDLADEPDYMPIDMQGYDEHHEGEQ